MYISTTESISFNNASIHFPNEYKEIVNNIKYDRAKIKLQKIKKRFRDLPLTAFSWTIDLTLVSGEINAVLCARSPYTLKPNKKWISNNLSFIPNKLFEPCKVLFDAYIKIDEHQEQCCSFFKDIKSNNINQEISLIIIK